jgi:hypothetical protein
MLRCSTTQQHSFGSSTAATSGSAIRAFRAVVSASCHIQPQQLCDNFRRFCRASRSWPRSRQPPIIFMGLLDTVGAKGIPCIKPPGHHESAFTYECFRDLVVSSEVQHVFQAVATHDRLAPFEPCAVRRSDKIVAGEGSSSSSTGHYPGVEFSLQEVWFPGKHCSQASCVAPQSHAGCNTHVI